MLKKIVTFIFEALHLKRIKHEWRRLAWINYPDSVAEHSLSAAQIWYILADMEWADSERVASMLVWHDLAETRIGDIHKVGARYWTKKTETEKHVLHDQCAALSFGPAIQDLFDEYEQRNTKEWRIAKDADYLEQAFQAKIYLEQGYAAAQDRINNVWAVLLTESAQYLRKHMQEAQSYDWWKLHWLKKK